MEKLIGTPKTKTKDVSETLRECAPNRTETGFIFQIAFIYVCVFLFDFHLFANFRHCPMWMSVARRFWSTCQQPLSSSEMLGISGSRKSSISN